MSPAVPAPWAWEAGAGRDRSGGSGCRDFQGTITSRVSSGGPRRDPEPRGTGGQPSTPQQGTRACRGCPTYPFPRAARRTLPRHGAPKPEIPVIPGAWGVSDKHGPAAEAWLPTCHLSQVASGGAGSPVLSASPMSRCCVLQRAEQLQAQCGAGDGRHRDRGDAELVSAPRRAGRSRLSLRVRDRLVCTAAVTIPVRSLGAAVTIPVQSLAMLERTSLLFWYFI